MGLELGLRKVDFGLELALELEIALGKIGDRLVLRVGVSWN